MPVVRVNFVRGTLSLALDAGAVIVAADALTDLPLVADPDVAWLSLDPYAEHGAPEIVKVTAHSPGASTATVVRGQQTGEGGSAARDHPAGTTVEQAITVLDLGVIEDDVLAAAADAADALASAATKVPLSQKGAANGVASLGADTKIPTSQLPTLVINDIYEAADEAAMLALPANQGDMAIRSDVSATFILGDEPATVLGNWIELPSPGAVTSVNGQTGVIVLDAADVGAATPASVTAEENARTAADALLIPLTQKAAANGVATLGADSKIPTAQLPALAITNTSVVANEAAMLALTAEPGDVAIRTDFTPRRAFILVTAPASTLGNWEALDPATSVTSVNGLTGDVTGLIPTTQKGAASGVATLDGTTRIPSAQIPTFVPTFGVGAAPQAGSRFEVAEGTPASTGLTIARIIGGSTGARLPTLTHGLAVQLYPAAGWSDPGMPYQVIAAHMDIPAGVNFVPWGVVSAITSLAAATNNGSGVANVEPTGFWAGVRGSGGAPLWGFTAELADKVGATATACDMMGVEIACYKYAAGSTVKGVFGIAKGDQLSEFALWFGREGAGTGWKTGARLEGFVLGTSLGDVNDLLSLQNEVGGGNVLQTFLRHRRTAAGSGWANVSLRLQNRVDATDHGFLGFNGNNVGINTDTQWGGGNGVLALATRTVAPTGSPTGAVLFEFDGTNLKAHTPAFVKTLTAPDELVVPAGAFGLANGSPTLESAVNTLGIASGWRLDPTTNEQVSALVLVPSGWATCDVELWWANTAAGAGNVRWRVTLKSIGDGELFTTATSDASSTIAAPAADTMKKSTLTTGAAVTSGELVKITIIRTADDGADTLANDASMVAVVLRRAS